MKKKKEYEEGECAKIYKLLSEDKIDNDTGEFVEVSQEKFWDDFNAYIRYVIRLLVSEFEEYKKLKGQ